LNYYIGLNSTIMPAHTKSASDDRRGILNDVQFQTIDIDFLELWNYVTGPYDISFIGNCLFEIRRRNHQASIAGDRVTVWNIFEPSRAYTQRTLITLVNLGATTQCCMMTV